MGSRVENTLQMILDDKTNFSKPLSRVEDILQKIVNDDDYKNIKPESNVEELLIELGDKIQGGGGSGGWQYPSIVTSKSFVGDYEKL